MPSPQQKSAKKTPQKYLISRPNPISVILRMDFPWSRKRLSGVFKGKYKISIVTESVKIKKSRSSWKMFQVVFKFSKISSMISKTLSWHLSKPTVNRHLSKKMGKKTCAKEICKISWDIPTNFYCRLLTNIWNLPAIYKSETHKSSNFSKIRQDPPNLVFFLQVYEIKKISIPVVFYYI